MTAVQRLLLVARALLEAGVVAGLAWSGYRAGGGGVLGVVLAVLVPAVGFGLWGIVDFRDAGRLAEPLRLAEELLISGLAALGVAATGHPAWAWALFGFSLGYHVLVYAAGERLLAPRPARPGTGVRGQP
jgi:Protein of unknown function (DUF2568)